MFYLNEELRSTPRYGDDLRENMAARPWDHE